MFWILEEDEVAQKQRRAEKIYEEKERERERCTCEMPDT